MKRMRGQVTIFISMILMCCFALLCVLVESARTAGAAWYLQTAAASALDSVFSQYHRELWDSYRLLFAEYEDEEELKTDFAAFLNPYLEAGRWYPMELKDSEVESWLFATDDNGMYLEQEILDYMKYGVWKLDFEADTPGELLVTAEEAESVQRIAERYRGHAGEALKLERALEAISDNQEKQQEQKNAGLSELRSYSCGGFCREAERLIAELEKVPGLVAEYSRQADALAERLSESREFFGQEKENCTEGMQETLDAEIREYEAYVDEDGKRRREVEALTEFSARQIDTVRDIIDEAEEVQEIIDNWEDDDDEEDDGPDLASLWAPVIRHFAGLEIRSLSFRHGVKDKEKEGWLKQVQSLVNADFLELVLPEGRDASAAVADRGEFPSETEVMTPDGRGISLTDHLLVNQYAGDFFRTFLTEETREGILQYEMEYLIQGGEDDTGNLTGALKKLFAVREGLNLAYLLSDSGKRSEARSMAMTITGITGVAPLVLLTTFFILSVWAVGETFMDLRGLLAGKKVPLWKSDGTWTLSADQLLEMGKNRRAETGGGEEGLSYLSWLKILLFMDDIVVQEYRMMDMIQMNIRRKQNAFRMRRALYEVRLAGSLRGKHVFFSPVFVQNLTGGGDTTYPMSVSAERRY